MRLAPLWVLLGLVNLAHADPEGRKRAETLEREARDTGDLAKYVACGQAYLGLYNADPAQPRAEELLYNAGVCFTAGKDAAPAIQMFEQLRAKHARSPLAARALGRLASLYQALSDLPKAGAALEEYATKYAGERDAYMALSEAARVYRALGNEAKQVAVAEQFARTFGAKRPREAADAMFSLIPLYERRGVGPAIEHLKRFLQDWGGKTTLEQRMAALAKLGELQWRQACPVTPIDGLCLKAVTVKPDPAGVRMRCEPFVGPRLEVVPRAEQTARAAVSTLQQALRLDGPNTDAASRAVLARARLTLADRDAETFLAVLRFPTGLDFDPAKKKEVREASMKRFQTFVSDAQRLGGEASKAYETILALKDPVSTIVAASRLARLAEAFGDTLVHGEIPKDVRSGEFAAEKVKAFCDQMTGVAEPLYARAKEAQGVCAAKSAELGLAGPWPKTCRRGADELVPRAFGLAMLREPVIAAAPRHSKALAALLAEAHRLGARPARAECTKLAGKLEGVGKQDRDADAFFVAGLVLRRCDAVAEARAMFGKARDLDPKHAAALASLGELSWAAGNRDAARAQWRDALALDRTLFTPYANLAIATLGELVDGRAADPKAALYELARYAASAQVVAPDRALPPALLAIAQLVAPHGAREVARYHADEAWQRDPKDPVVLALQIGLWLDQGLAVGTALEELGSGPLDDATTLALALHLMRVQRWDTARSLLAGVATKSYERAVALGILARVAGKPADAEARYTEAIALAPARPEAHFDLGLLLKEHVAPTAADRKATLRRAAESFRRAATAEALALAAECDRLAK